MTVTSATFSRGGWTGGVDEKLNATYRLSYHATTDNLNDGPETVLSYFYAQSALPFIGDTYAVGSDTDTYAACVAVDAKPNKDNPKLWAVTADFKLPEFRDKDNKPTTDPTKRRNEISVSFSTFTKTATEGELLEPHRVGPFVAGDRMPLLTCGAVPSPVPEALLPDKMAGDQIVNFTFYTGTFDATKYRPYVLRAVNSDVRTFNDLSYGYIDRWELRTALLTNASGQLLYENGIIFWRITLSVHLKQDTWDARIPNKNFYRSAGVRDPDGQGGEITGNNDLPHEGGQASPIIMDRQGNPVTEPVWLDITGQPLPPNDKNKENPAPDEFIFLRYNLYETLPYSALGL